MGIMRKILGFILVCTSFFPAAFLMDVTKSVIPFIVVTVALMLVGVYLIRDKEEIARLREEKIRNRAPYYTKADKLERNSRKGLGLGALFIGIAVLAAFFVPNGTLLVILLLLGVAGVYLVIHSILALSNAREGTGWNSVGSLTYYCPHCRAQVSSKAIPSDSRAVFYCPNCGSLIKSTDG